jgi:hypothetical protein
VTSSRPLPAVVERFPGDCDINEVEFVQSVGHP